MQLLPRGAPLVVIAVLAGCGPAPEADPGLWRPIARPDAAVDGQPPEPEPPYPGAGGSGGAAGSAGPPGTGGSPGTVTPPDAGAGRADAGAGATGGSGGGAPDAGVVPSGPSATCALSVTVTTVTTGRDYAPENIGAVWIADGNGRFVKSLAVWANRRIQHLPRWNMATSAAGMGRDRTDAVTGATARTHVARTAKWNCSNAAGQQVPNGAFQVCYEMTESNSSDNNPPPRFQCLMFDKGPTAFEMMPADAPGFRARRLQFVP